MELANKELQHKVVIYLVAKWAGTTYTAKSAQNLINYNRINKNFLKLMLMIIIVCLMVIF